MQRTGKIHYDVELNMFTTLKEMDGKCIQLNVFFSTAWPKSY